jgi:NADH dehydrogenase FAD-containing subunit
MKARVLILGAGFGGLELATKLSEELGEEAAITRREGRLRRQPRRALVRPLGPPA